MTTVTFHCALCGKRSAVAGSRYRHVLGLRSRICARCANKEKK